MSSAQDRSSGMPTGAHATGATGSGGTGGEGATGPTTGTRGTTTGMQEQAGRQQTPSASYERGAAPSAEYRTAGGGHRASTGSIVGGVLAVVAGLLAFLAGLGVVVRPHFYPTVNGYAYAWNGRGWGWILLILGVVLFAAGASAMLGIAAARPVAIGLAVLTAIAGFLWLVYTPILGIVVVALSVFAIWGLLRDGTEQREPM